MVKPNRRESLANKYSIEELKQALENYKPKPSVEGCKNALYVGGTGEKYKRIWIKGQKIKMSHIVWRINHQEKIPIGYNIHHKDENKRNDMIDNLELVKADEHGKGNLKRGVKW